MMRSSQRDASRRAFVNLVRGTFKKADDTKRMQSIDFSLFFDEAKTQVERFQNYGLTSVPLPPSNGKGAEHITLLLGSHRTHAVTIAVDDRRYRLQKMQNGEVALYDDQGQQVFLSRDRVIVHAPAGKEVVVQTADDAHFLLNSTKVKMQKGSRSFTILTDKILIGSETGATHKVLTTDGPSSVVFSVIDETDGAMTAATIAKGPQS